MSYDFSALNSLISIVLLVSDCIFSKTQFIRKLCMKGLFCGENYSLNTRGISQKT